MNKIQLDEKFSIEKDSRSWNLIQRKSPKSLKNGDPVFDEQGERIWNVDETFHMNLKQALIVYLDKSMKPADSVQDAIDRINQAEHNVEQALLQLKD